MRVVYSILVLLSTPLVLLYFAFRGFRDRTYLNRWSERLGFIGEGDNQGGILIHAASVGEFNAANPLIMALIKAYPELPLAVTAQTPTGSSRIENSLGGKVFHCYLPLDLPGAVSRFLDTLQPRLIVIMETERWPNLYLQAKQRKIPLIIANARLSERSVNRFQVARGFVQEVMGSVAWIGAQSANDRERLVQSGAHPNSTVIAGNLKFDMGVPASLEEKAAALRTGWSSHRPVLVAGSTHEEDENVIIPAFVELLKKLPDALLVLVPRHPERFARATQLAKNSGLRTELRSQGESCSPEAQCFVIDAMGELMTYYACADLAFVGGSIGKQGGHNALEPVALGKPVLFGPEMENARDIAAQLLEHKAARCIVNQADFVREAEQILTDGVLRDRMGQAGRRLIESNKGALDLTLQAIAGRLKQAGKKKNITPQEAG